jgi:hypothetical protein
LADRSADSFGSPATLAVFPTLHGAIGMTGDPDIVETLLQTRAVIGIPK